MERAPTMEQMILGLLHVAGGTAEGLVRLFEEDLLTEKDPRTSGGTLLEVATVLHPLGRNDIALSVVHRALEYFETCHDGLGICCCRINAGIYLDALRRFEEALESFRLAAECNAGLGDKSSESKIEVGLGRTYNNLGQFHTAISHYRRAQLLKERIGDPVGLAKCKTGLGIAHHSLGALDEAARLFHEVIGLSRELKDLEGEAGARMNLGNAYVKMSRFDEALAEHRAALAIGAKLKHRGTMASANINVGITLGNLGDYRGAIESNRAALEWIDDPVERGSALQNIGNGYFNLRQFKEALAFFHQALEIKVAQREPGGILLCTMNLGNTYGSLGDHEKALEYHDRALGAARGLGDRYNESLCLANLGMSMFLARRPAAAIERLRAASEVAHEVGATHLEAQAEFGQARVLREGLGDRERAYERCRVAIELEEELTRGLAHQDSKISFFSVMSQPYQYLVELCLEMGGKHEEAFGLLERMKSRSLVELLSTQRIEPRQAAGDELRRLRQREEELLGALRELQTRAWRQPGASAAPDELKSARRELSKLYGAMSKHDPEYVSLRRGDTVTAAQVKRFVDDAGRPLVLVEYFVGADFVSTFVISCRKAGLTVVPKVIAAGELQGLVQVKVPR
jgi:tetratricopeptide (TPR) repeat protein